MINVLINGKPKTLNKKLSLKNIIDQFAGNPERTIAEVNGTIIENSKWDTLFLQDGDKLELVSFVGGG